MITVTGDIKLADGSPHNGQIILYPGSTPIAVGSVFYFTSPIYVDCDVNGSFAVTLAPGEYWVHCVISKTKGNVRQNFRIRVPQADENGDPDGTILLPLLVQDNLNRPAYFGGLPTTGSSVVSIVDTSGTAYRGVAALRSRTAHLDTQLAHLAFVATRGDGGQGMFEYVSASTATDDGLNVLKPDDIDSADPGRWIRLS